MSKQNKKIPVRMREKPKNLPPEVQVPGNVTTMAEESSLTPNELVGWDLVEAKYALATEKRASADELEKSGVSMQTLWTSGVKARLQTGDNDTINIDVKSGKISIIRRVPAPPK